MKRTFIALAAITAAGLATPALAGGKTATHTHYCNCGHTSGSAQCGGSSSSSTTSSSTSTGGTTTSSSSGGTSGGTTSTTSGGTTSTTSGGTTSTSSGGTAVPEPGMIGMMGLSLVALGAARSRRRKQAA